MKIFVISSIIIFICLLTGIFLFYYVQNTSMTYTHKIEEIKALVGKELWEEASNELLDLDKKWQDTEKVWKTVIEHAELDNIQKTFASVKEYIREEEKPHSLAELADLKFFINHILEKEKLNLQNIF
ncbi:MAG: DUF4363 family protein [Eubacteriales bacterium]